MGGEIGPFELVGSWIGYRIYKKSKKIHFIFLFIFLLKSHKKMVVHVPIFGSLE